MLAFHKLYQIYEILGSGSGSGLDGSGSEVTEDGSGSNENGSGSDDDGSGSGNDGSGSGENGSGLDEDGSGTDATTTTSTTTTGWTTTTTPPKTQKSMWNQLFSLCLTLTWTPDLAPKGKAITFSDTKFSLKNFYQNWADTNQKYFYVDIFCLFM